MKNQAMCRNVKIWNFSKKYLITIILIDVIISGSYRVKSHQDVQNRICTTQHFKEYLVNLYNERIKSGSFINYIIELQEGMR
jgi:hypothetical protein